jgi:beta-lactamase class D
MPPALREWEQDLDLAGPLKVSCVPSYQDVARRGGSEWGNVDQR